MCVGVRIVADLLMPLNLALGSANAILAALLLALYGSMYRRSRSTFTVGLMVFAAAFLVQNLFVVYSLVAMMSYVEGPLAPYLAGIAILEAVGLAAILWTTWR